MSGDDGNEEDDEEELCFMILADGFEGDSAHEALDVDRLLEHGCEISGNIRI